MLANVYTISKDRFKTIVAIVLRNFGLNILNQNASRNGHSNSRNLIKAELTKKKDF